MNARHQPDFRISTKKTGVPNQIFLESVYIPSMNRLPFPDFRCLVEDASDDILLIKHPFHACLPKIVPVEKTGFKSKQEVRAKQMHEDIQLQKAAVPFQTTAQQIIVIIDDDTLGAERHDLQGIVVDIHEILQGHPLATVRPPESGIEGKMLLLPFL